MNKENTRLRDMMPELSTAQLDELLAQELQSAAPDEEKVRQILAILREREKDETAEITPEVQQAWEKYQKDSRKVSESAAVPRKIPTWLVRAASIGLVFLLLIPQNAQADTFWERLTRWTSEVFEFFSPHAKEAVQEPYVFKTDHPGLQQIYDAVVELGITEPMVPMWLPDGYELTEHRAGEGLGFVYVHARLSDETNVAIIEVRKYDSLIPGQYEKDDTKVKVLEFQGNVHYVMRNRDRWNVAWTKDNVEGFLTVDCQEDELHNMLKSIYGMEVYP